MPSWFVVAAEMAAARNKAVVAAMRGLRRWAAAQMKSPACAAAQRTIVVEAALTSSADSAQDVRHYGGTFVAGSP